MRYVLICMGSGREIMSSALHSCVENQHLKTDPFYFQNCFFSAQKLEISEEPEMPFKKTFIFP